MSTKPKCDICGECDGQLYLHAVCHPDAGLTLSVHDDQGFAACAECGKPVAAMTITDIKAAKVAA
jgi:hypothetical protein